MSQSFEPEKLFNLGDRMTYTQVVENWEKLQEKFALTQKIRNLFQRDYYSNTSKE